MLFVIGTVVVLGLIIGFCVMMDRLEQSHGKHEADDVVVYYVTDNYSDPNRDWDPLDPANPYHDCPYCGSSDTDGNHCYDCDEDF